MQDRSPPTRQIFLLRTAGPYIWVKSGHWIVAVDVRYSPKSGRVLAECPLCAKSGHRGAEISNTSPQTQGLNTQFTCLVSSRLSRT
jgi:hypothetical protein